MLRDLREYIGALQELGDVCTVEREVDPNLELGAVIRRSYEIGAPAPLFTNIKGTAPKGGGIPTRPKVTYDALLRPEGEGRERRASFRFLYPENIKQRVVDPLESRVTGR
jgi:UbiD family decarboxylase